MPIRLLMYPPLRKHAENTHVTSYARCFLAKLIFLTISTRMRTTRWPPFALLVLALPHAGGNRSVPVPCSFLPPLGSLAAPHAWRSCRSTRALSVCLGSASTVSNSISSPSRVCARLHPPFSLARCMGPLSVPTRFTPTDRRRHQELARHEEGSGSGLGSARRGRPRGV